MLSPRETAASSHQNLPLMRASYCSECVALVLAIYSDESLNRQDSMGSNWQTEKGGLQYTVTGVRPDREQPPVYNACYSDTH